MIRVGLVGYGLAGSVFHAPLIRACQRMELAAVQTSRDVPERVASFDESCHRSDLVVVASPNQTHFPLVRAALAAGKHVVVDKPFTVTLDEADALIALAREQHRVLTVFQNRRLDGDFLTPSKSSCRRWARYSCSKPIGIASGRPSNRVGAKSASSAAAYSA